MSKKENFVIRDNIIEQTRRWLGKEGISFFRKILDEHGVINACWAERYKGITIPHPVHFREGMDVRNFLRTLPECECWTAHQLDDRWAKVIEKVIKNI